MRNVQFRNIETGRLILRKFKQKDASAFLTYRTDPKVALYQGEGFAGFDLAKAVEFVEEQMNFEPGIPDTWFQIAIESKDTGCLIGDCAIHTLPDDEYQVEIGFTISPLNQHTGFGNEAVRCMLAYLFGDLKMHRVIAITDVRNKDCISLLERVGMRKEGHFLKNAWNKGEYTDEYLYAMLIDEWIDRNRPDEYINSLLH